MSTSRDDRLAELIECTTLGKIVPLWGVTANNDGTLRCECSKPPGTCKTPGKHPRKRHWQEQASKDAGQIAEWLTTFPHANFGIVCGDGIIALDADERPGNGKAGAHQLEWLELDHRERLPYTVSVETGRGNGSKHLYFRVPSHIDIDRLTRPFRDVDLIKDGFCIAPGSRHISGGLYRFTDEQSPGEQEIVELPKMLLDVLCPGHDQQKATLPKPGRFRPDWVVLLQLRRDPVTKGRFFDGERRYSKDRSADDFALACKLAFYTSHHWDQAMQLFRQSALFGAKNHSWSTGNYITETMTKAFLHTEANWTEKPRPRKSRATGAKAGRKMSSASTAVLELKQKNPALAPKDIATEVGLSPAHVRKILSRYAPVPGGVTQSSHANTQNPSVPDPDPHAARLAA